ncbi:regulator of MON1-CCZ1 complex-like [Dysidea avara]|uniref:regulator of MON1-CCZ1 complex-like n=1 Tax=Dysidea avara TaxID=196820 RepID=UPI00332FBC4A
MMSARSVHYLELEEIPIHFESINKVEGAFFDLYNFQMFTVHRGNTDVKVKGLKEDDNFKMTIPPKGPVLSIKFSGGEQKVLSIQRKKTHVEFVNVFASHNQEVFLPVKPSGGSEVVSFHWLFKNEYLILILTTGVEIYQFLGHRLQFRYLKGYSINVAWAHYFPDELTLLVCAKGSNIIHPFQFRKGISPPVMRLPKFEVDIPTVRGMKPQLSEQDVSLAKLYKAIYVCVVRNNPQGQQDAEVLLYHLVPDGSAKMMHILEMHCSGRFMISVTDNIVVIHHQASKTSMIFDIAFNGEKKGSLLRHYPVLAPLPIAPCTLKLPPTSSTSSINPGQAAQVIHPEMYSPKWVPFAPRVIVDAQYGVMWWVNLKLDAISAMLPSKDKVVDFLLLRKDGHDVILNICREALEPGQQYPLNVISSIFDKLNVAYKIATSAVHTQDQLPYRADKLVIDQKQVYTKVFAPFIDRKDLQYKFLVATVVEYIRSLHKLHIHVEHFLYEMVINLLIENKCFYQLHQFLQYHVISDSRPLACLLLSRELVYPPAQQLALDMFKRLSESDSDIIDILLSSGQLLTALRFVKSVGKVDTVSARQFLEAAANEGDKMLFNAVYKFFEERNIRLRKNAEFPHGEDCKQYELLYRKWFGAHE